MRSARRTGRGSLGIVWRALVLSLLMVLPATVRAESDMYGHYQELRQHQSALQRRSLEDQERLQSQMRQAEIRACAKLRQDQRQGIRLETYSRQGDAEFGAFVQQFDRYCDMLIRQ